MMELLAFYLPRRPGASADMFWMLSLFGAISLFIGFWSARGRRRHNRRATRDLAFFQSATQRTGGEGPLALRGTIVHGKTITDPIEGREAVFMHLSVIDLERFGNPYVSSIALNQTHAPTFYVKTGSIHLRVIVDAAHVSEIATHRLTETRDKLPKRLSEMIFAHEPFGALRNRRQTRWAAAMGVLRLGDEVLIVGRGRAVPEADARFGELGPAAFRDAPERTVLEVRREPDTPFVITQATLDELRRANFLVNSAERSLALVTVAFALLAWWLRGYEVRPWCLPVTLTEVSLAIVLFASRWLPPVR